MKFYYTPIRMAKIWNSNNTSADKGVEQQELWFISGGNANNIYCGCHVVEYLNFAEYCFGKHLSYLHISLVISVFKLYKMGLKRTLL